MARHIPKDSVGSGESSEASPGPEVIVRAWNDEPVRLYVESVGGSHVVVGNALTGATVGFPRERVYLFDAAVFESLKGAFERGLKDELSAIWLTASGV